MFKFQQSTVKKKVVRLWLISTVYIFYIVLPSLVYAGECVSTGSGASCTG